MTKIYKNPYYSKFFYKKSLYNYSLQSNIYSFSTLPKFTAVNFSINIPKKTSNNYNTVRSFYFLYIVTGFKPIFVTNKRKTTLTVSLNLSGQKMYSILSFFYFLRNSERYRIMSPSSYSSNSVDFSFHDPSALFNFRGCRFDYHNWPYKVRINFACSSYYFDNNLDLLLYNINFPRFFLFEKK